MTQDQADRSHETPGLRGCGGGGFPTGKKWEFTKQSQADEKFVICNADEGDPGAFVPLNHGRRFTA